MNSSLIQLDIRTKLCIRDSLYRLARSAEQRHNCVNADVGTRDDRDTSCPLMDQETNKYVHNSIYFFPFLFNVDFAIIIP